MSGRVPNIRFLQRVRDSRLRALTLRLTKEVWNTPDCEHFTQVSIKYVWSNPPEIHAENDYLGTPSIQVTPTRDHILQYECKLKSSTSGTLARRSISTTTHRPEITLGFDCIAKDRKSGRTSQSSRIGRWSGLCKHCSWFDAIVSERHSALPNVITGERRSCEIAVCTFLTCHHQLWDTRKEVEC